MSDQQNPIVLPGQPAPGTAMVSAAEVEAQIRNQLAEVNKRTAAPGQNKISVKGKQFTLPGQAPRPGPLYCVILDYIWAMAHYPGVFNQNKPQDPNCFAIGREKPETGLLKPHESAPEKQGENCRTCPKNQWKSDPKGGNGKACKNQRRLLIVPQGADENAQPFTIYVSPKGLKNFDAYVRQLASEQNIDPIQAITAIDFNPAEAYPMLTFTFVEKHANLVTMWGLKERYKAMTEHVIEVKQGDND